MTQKSDIQVFVEEDLKTYGWGNIAPLFFASWVSGLPCVLIGEPGASKTTFLMRFSQALDQKTEILDLKYLTAVRLLGIPNPDKLKQGKLEYVGGLIATRPRIVILDELTRCNDNVQSLILEFVRESRLDQTYIACKRVATCNPPSADLVNVSHLDYAAATRLIHIEVPTLSKELSTKFIDEWGLSWEPSEDCIKMSNYIDSLKLELPSREKLDAITKSLVKVLFEFKFNGRQVNNLMRLLTASYTIEKAGLHKYTNEDIARLAISLVPFSLTKHKWKADPDTLVINMSSELAEFPWQAEKSEIKERTSSVEVEVLKRNMSVKSMEELVKLSKEGQPLESFVAFEVLIGLISKDNSWKKSFDGFDSLIKLG